MSSSPVTSTSTAVVPYDHTLPHIYIKSHLEAGSDIIRRTANAYRGALQSQYLNTYKALHLGGKETLESRMIRSAATSCPTHSAEETTQRLNNYKIVAEHLTDLSNDELSRLLDEATPLGFPSGGEILSMEVKGVPLFVKKIRLSTVEQQNPKSTRNLFELPPNYQYGVGSFGFGAWREISAHEMTTQWVLSGECQNFPLMYHSRVLQRTSPPTVPTTAEERRGYVKYWDGSAAVGKRSEAIDTASADVVVFMEHLPQTLNNWLIVEGGKGNLDELALTKLERELNMVAIFMKSRGFLHFDAHFDNILASNNHIYFADFGLAMSRSFDLSTEESVFFEKHTDYDRCYVVRELATNATAGTILPSALESVAQKYLPIAVIFDKFLQDLREVSKSTPYPVVELSREWAVLSSCNQ